MPRRATALQRQLCAEESEQIHLLQMQAQTVQTGGQECVRATKIQAEVRTGRVGVGESARAMPAADVAV